MFRFTIYSIVGYAFWLTFVDVSAYLEQNTEYAWVSTIKSEWTALTDEDKPEVLTGSLDTISDCQAENSCYEPSVPMGE